MFPIDNPFVTDSEKLKFGRIFTSTRQALVISGVDGLTSDIPGLMESPQLQLFRVLFCFIDGGDIRVRVGPFELLQRFQEWARMVVPRPFTHLASSGNDGDSGSTAGLDLGDSGAKISSMARDDIRRLLADWRFISCSNEKLVLKVSTNILQSFVFSSSIREVIGSAKRSKQVPCSVPWTHLQNIQ